MLNLNRLRKSEILWLFNNYCRHGHRYIEHMHCYDVEKPVSPMDERIGYLDIETTGLNANFDYIISYAILDNEGDYKGRVLKPEEATDWRILDKQLMKEFLDDVRYYDRLVVYWGKDRRHDMPFLRSRCMRWHKKFPLYREIYVTDCFDIVKGKLRLHRNRLFNVCDFFGIPSKGHRLDAEIWQRAKLGHKPSLKHVWEHNKEDVESLKAVHELLSEFTGNWRTSI